MSAYKSNRVRLTLRLPAKLMPLLQRLAEHHDTSINEIIVVQIVEGINTMGQERKNAKA